MWILKTWTINPVWISQCPKWRIYTRRKCPSEEVGTPHTGVPPYPVIITETLSKYLGKTLAKGRRCKWIWLHTIFLQPVIWELYSPQLMQCPHISLNAVCPLSLVDTSSHPPWNTYHMLQILGSFWDPSTTPILLRYQAYPPIFLLFHP